MRMPLKKILYLIKHRYNPYPLFWYDLLTERHLKNRVGECIDCYECCKHIGGGQCEHVDLIQKRCKVFNNRSCHEWFPVSQKDVDYRKQIQPGFKCKFNFN